MNKLLYSIAFFALIFGLIACKPNRKEIVSGTVWNDTDGKPINAHGGGVLFHEGTYYWYGEYKGDSTYRLESVKTWECWRAEAGGVSCYSSQDLVNWKFEGLVLPATPDDETSDLHPSQVIERPKVIYNAKNHQFVMWMHIESPNYEKACAGVAVADSPTGKFAYLGSFKPNGADSRDQTLFKDDDGRAYHIYSSEWNQTLYIGLLNDDYTRHTGVYTRNFIGQAREAPAVFKHRNKYYMITSGCTGWDPNVAECAVADSMLGEWTIIGNPCTGKDAEFTFYAQSTFVLPVAGTNKYIALFDRWNKTDLIHSSYVWFPLTFENGKPVITRQDKWTVAECCESGRSPDGGLQRPFVVYNNWSAYDELSDTIPQTEELSMRMLDEVIRLKKQGVQIDCYLMDAFWFDVNGGYRIWHKKHWPNGPGQWLKKCKENGIVPGLWFSTNLIQSGGEPLLNVIPEWADSQTSDKALLSLSEGGYLEHLIATLQMYADKGFKVFKFDFAYFDAASELSKSALSREEIEEANKEAFRQAIKKFRTANPDVLFIAYNGFGGDMEDTVTPFRQTVDLRWMDIFDTLYGGDPRFSDVPMVNIWRSQDLYNDHQVRQFAFNGLALSRIDNCAFMIGETGTCYKRGIAAWKSSLVLNLARGGWMNVYHGNINLLTDQDAAWFAEVQKTYLHLQQFGQLSIIGGTPGKAEVYGYKAETADGCLFTLVNPSQSQKEIELPGTSAQGRVIFTDKGFVPVLNAGKLTLGAEQMAVVGFGKYRADDYQWGIEEDINIPIHIEPLQAPVVTTGKHTAQMQLKNPSGNIRVCFSQTDSSGKPFRSWGGAPPNGVPMNKFLEITAKQGNQTIPVKINYNKMIWSGLSWATGEIESQAYDSGKTLTIICRSKEGESKYFKVGIYKT